VVYQALQFPNRADLQSIGEQAATTAGKADKHGDEKGGSGEKGGDAGQGKGGRGSEGG
jgi:hypothetical protein